MVWFLTCFVYEHLCLFLTVGRFFFYQWQPSRACTHADVAAAAAAFDKGTIRLRTNRCTLQCGDLQVLSGCISTASIPKAHFFNLLHFVLFFSRNLLPPLLLCQEPQPSSLKTPRMAAAKEKAKNAAAKAKAAGVKAAERSRSRAEDGSPVAGV